MPFRTAGLCSGTPLPVQRTWTPLGHPGDKAVALCGAEARIVTSLKRCCPDHIRVGDVNFMRAAARLLAVATVVPPSNRR
jgi:hypothetical protein